MTTTLTLIPPTVDVPVATELAHVIAEKIIASLERDDRLIGEFTLSNLEGLATDIQVILSQRDRYEIAAAR